MSTNPPFIRLRPITLQEYAEHFHLSERYSQDEIQELYDDWLMDFYHNTSVYCRAMYERYERFIRREFHEDHGWEEDEEIYDWPTEEWVDFALSKGLDRYRSVYIGEADMADEAKKRIERVRMKTKHEDFSSMAEIANYLDRIHKLNGPRGRAVNELWFDTIIRNPPEVAAELRRLPYDEYRKTEHWQRVRAAMLLIYMATCQEEGCSGSGDRWYGGDEGYLHVHHLSYKNRGNERFADLTLLCNYHHEQWHKHAKDPEQPPVKLAGSSYTQA